MNRRSPQVQESYTPLAYALVSCSLMHAEPLKRHTTPIELPLAGHTLFAPLIDIPHGYHNQPPCAPRLSFFAPHAALLRLCICPIKLPRPTNFEFAVPRTSDTDTDTLSASDSLSRWLWRAYARRPPIRVFQVSPPRRAFDSRGPLSAPACNAIRGVVCVAYRARELEHSRSAARVRLREGLEMDL